LCAIATSAGSSSSKAVRIGRPNSPTVSKQLAKTPLLIGMDLEWGLAMRLDSTIRFPRQMTLGALRSDTLIEAMGMEIAREMKRLGVQVSFSPVVDVNNNPSNPVINDRSFGEDRELVARKGIAYMRGLQEGGVIATAKHFPGHGDTDTDSHLGLP
jgi:beta-N-acetylhexosaminidase